jgi:hypothetical protein
MREDSSSPKSQNTQKKLFITRPTDFQIGELSNSGLFFEEED